VNTALIVVDMLNTYEHADAEPLMRSVRDSLPAMRRLLDVARASARSDVAFVIKARHSIFYETQVEYLLRQHEFRRLVLVGQVTEQCILYSAHDAYVRHFESSSRPRRWPTSTRSSRPPHCG
jgi:nicotinamidase-related amidase